MNLPELGEPQLLQFKVAVERAVRPVKCSYQRKRWMREELLEHLRGTAARESERTGDLDSACSRALLHFGDPQELSAQLQASVPWWDRPVTALQWFCGPYSPNVSPVKMLGRMMAFAAGFNLLCFALVAALMWSEGRGREILPMAHILAILCLTTLIFAFPFHFVSLRLGRIVLGDRTAGGRGEVIWLLIAAAALMPFWLAITVWAMAGSLAGPAWTLVLAYVVAPLFGPMLALVQGRNVVKLQLELEAWDRLAVGE